MALGTLWLKNFRKRINTLNFSELFEETGLPVYHNTLPILHKELSRMRRFERPLAVAVLQPNGIAADKPNAYSPQANNANGNDNKSISQVEFILCGLVFNNSIRDIDMLSYDTQKNQFIISLPETNKAQAHFTIERIKKLIGIRMAGQLAVGVAEFPDNGLILEDLIEHAAIACKSKIEESPPRMISLPR